MTTHRISAAPCPLPDRSSTLRRTARRLWAWVQRHRDRRDARAAFLHMAAQDDRGLADMGLTRQDVDWAARLPLSRNAALEAHKAARARRQADPLTRYDAQGMDARAYPVTR